MFIDNNGSTKSRKLKKTTLETGDVILFHEESNCISAGRSGTPLYFCLEGKDKFMIPSRDCLADFLRLIADLHGVSLKKVANNKYGNGNNEAWEVNKLVFVKGKGYCVKEAQS